MSQASLSAQQKDEKIFDKEATLSLFSFKDVLTKNLFL